MVVPHGSWGSTMTVGHKRCCSQPQGWGLGSVAWLWSAIGHTSEDSGQLLKAGQQSVS